MDRRGGAHLSTSYYYKYLWIVISFFMFSFHSLHSLAQSTLHPLCKLNIPLPIKPLRTLHFHETRISFSIFSHHCFHLLSLPNFNSILILRLRTQLRENRNKEGKKIWSLNQGGFSGWGWTEKSQAEKKKKKKKRNPRWVRRRFRVAVAGRKWWLGMPWRPRRRRAFCSQTSLPLHGIYYLPFIFFCIIFNILFHFHKWGLPNQGTFSIFAIFFPFFYLFFTFFDHSICFSFCFLSVKAAFAVVGFTATRSVFVCVVYSGGTILHRA